MLGLERIIRHMDDEIYQGMRESLLNSKAVKFLTLLDSYRKEKDEQDILSELNITKNAYNVLKSRLYDKVQKHLISTNTEIDNEVLLQTFRIPSLTFNSEKQTALTVLDGLEKEFEQLDLFEFLILISSARKRLTYNTPKYYEHSKIYNKYVALHLSLQKAEDELLQFNLTLSTYHLQDGADTLQLLKVYKSEIEKIASIEDSTKFKMIRHLVNASLLIFAPEAVDDKRMNVETELKTCEDLVLTIPRDLYSIYYSKAIDTLYFLYYSNLELYGNAARYLSLAVQTATEKINYYPLVCTLPVCEQHLLTDIALNQKPSLIEWIEPSVIYPGTPEFFTKIAVSRFNALVHFLHNNPQKGLEEIKQVINEFNLKDYPFAEIEIKFIYLLLSIEAKKEVNQDSILTSIGRRLREIKKTEQDPTVFSLALQLFKLSFATRTPANLKNINKKLSDIKNTPTSRPAGFHKLIKTGIFDKTFLKTLN